MTLVLFGSTTGRCEALSKLIATALGITSNHCLNVALTSPTTIPTGIPLICGISSWGNGDMQEDWPEFLAGCTDAFWLQRPCALFGIGDQIGYPLTFQGGMGTLATYLLQRGALLAPGMTTDGFQFKDSPALSDAHHFVGCALDEDNQPELSTKRINQWLASLPGCFRA